MTYRNVTREDELSGSELDSCFLGTSEKKILKFALNTLFEKWQLEFSCFSALILTGSNSNS